MINPLDISNDHLYLLGPIIGEPSLNIKYFDDTEKYLLDKDYKVINPHSLIRQIIHSFQDLSNYTQKKFFDSCICWMSVCETIVLLNDWEYNEFSIREFEIAKLMDKKIIDIKKL